MKLGCDTTLYRNHQLARPRADEPMPITGMSITVLRRHDRLIGSLIEVFDHEQRLFVRTLCAENTGLSVEYVFFKTQAGTWQHVRLNKKKTTWEPSSATSLYLGVAPMADEQEV